MPANAQSHAQHSTRSACNLPGIVDVKRVPCTAARIAGAHDVAAALDDGQFWHERRQLRDEGVDFLAVLGHFVPAVSLLVAAEKPHVVTPNLRTCRRGDPSTVCTHTLTHARKRGWSAAVGSPMATHLLQDIRGAGSTATTPKHAGCHAPSLILCPDFGADVARLHKRSRGAVHTTIHNH